MSAESRLLKKLIANELFQQMESNERAFQSNIAKRPQIHVTELIAREYEFKRLDDSEAIIKVPGPYGPTYFRIKITEMI